MLHPLVVLLLSFITAAVASPTPEKRQSVTTLSNEQVAAFKPYTFYTSAAHCNPARTKAWDCGANCDANPTFRPTASGGNGGSEQFWYVGYDPTLKEVIVGYQGTDPTKIEADLTDIDFILSPLSATLFPNVPKGVLVHSGFRKAHADNAVHVLEAVKSTLGDNSATSVKVVGHSLGAALATLNTVYLRLQLDSSISIGMIAYGSPRVGNSAFADFAESLGVQLTRINNKGDIIPALFPRFLGYTHPAGEIHINADNTWTSCSGRENTSKQCTLGAISVIILRDDHGGPYDGVQLGCSSG